MRTMTFRQLWERMVEIAAAISDDAQDKLEVVVRCQQGDECCVGGLTSVEIDQGCTEVDSLMLDGTSEAESAWGVHDEFDCTDSAQYCVRCSARIIGSHACGGAP